MTRFTLLAAALALTLLAALAPSQAQAQYPVAQTYPVPTYPTRLYPAANGSFAPAGYYSSSPYAAYSVVPAISSYYPAPVALSYNPGYVVYPGTLGNRFYRVNLGR